MNIAIPHRYRQLRASVPFERVSLGYRAVHLTPVAILAEAQRGYGLVPEGDETDWDSAWVVIGSEDLCGDPIFIDTDDEDFPVYTAAHGQGQWRPRLIAFSFEHFIQALHHFGRFRHGHSSPVELERQPITDTERESLLSFIRHHNPDVNMPFWETWLETDP